MSLDFKATVKDAWVHISFQDKELRCKVITEEHKGEHTLYKLLSSLDVEWQVRAYIVNGNLQLNLITSVHNNQYSFLLAVVHIGMLKHIPESKKEQNTNEITEIPLPDTKTFSVAEVLYNAGEFSSYEEAEKELKNTFLITSPVGTDKYFGNQAWFVHFRKNDVITLQNGKKYKFV